MAFYLDTESKVTKMKTGCCTSTTNGDLFLGHVRDFPAVNDILVLVINGSIYKGTVLHCPVSDATIGFVGSGNSLLMTYKQILRLWKIHL